MPHKGHSALGLLLLTGKTTAQRQVMYNTSDNSRVTIKDEDEDEEETGSSYEEVKEQLKNPDVPVEENEQEPEPKVDRLDKDKF